MNKWEIIGFIAFAWLIVAWTLIDQKLANDKEIMLAKVKAHSCVIQPDTLKPKSVTK